MSGVDVIVDDQLRIDMRQIPRDAVEEIQLAHTHVNSHRKKLKAMGVPHWGEPAEYKTWKTSGFQLIVPRGGTGTIRGALARRGLHAVFRDRRIFPVHAMPAHRLTLRPDQIQARDAILKTENCVVRAPTGAGKTCMALGAISAIGSPSLIVVWNATLMKQWVTRISTELGVRESDVGKIRGGKIGLRPLTVAMQQTLWKLDQGEREMVRRYFGVIVMDEVHRAAARTFVEVIDWMPARYRIGLSADERRSDRKEFLIYDEFGGVAYDSSREALEAAGAVVDVEVRVALTSLSAGWYDDAPKAGRDKLLLDLIEKDDDRTALAAEIAASEALEGHQVIVFSHRREHCERLRAAISARGMNCGLMIGGASDAADLDSAVRGLNDGSLRIAVATIQAVGTGVDLPSVTRGVIATPLASSKQMWGQVRGRFCRAAAGKAKALVHYLHDQNVFGSTPVRALKRWNKVVTVATQGKILSAKEWLKTDEAESSDTLLTELTRARESLADLISEKGLEP